MRHLLLVAASTCAALLVGCPVSGDRSCEELASCPDDGTDASTADGSRDTSAPDASPDGAPPPDATPDADAGPPPCNTALDPKSAPCVVDETLGVFVAPTGSDTTGDGTKAKPYATITKAVAAPRPGMLRAFVCAGTYKEPAVVTAAADGVAIYGALDCATWAYDAANKVLVAPTAHGPALTVTGIATGLTIEDVEFDAQAGTAPGESSIAGVVSRASGVTLRRVRLVAGAGVDGAPGVVPSTSLQAAEVGIASDTSPGIGGGHPTKTTCPFGPTSIGGQGGAGGDTPTPGSTGLPGPSNGGVGSAACSNTLGGVSAPAVASNGPGATKLGSASNLSWMPGAGAKGEPGGTGQGGGGGAGAMGPGNGGASGGSGGCGGDGGGPGAGGGASVALMAIGNLTVALEDSTLTSSKAGAGGAGAVGQAGAAGADRGRNNAGSGCNGGPGGSGGRGGAGGGGAGGISVGILFTGGEPLRDAATVATTFVGAAGAAGVGGAPTANDGVAGVKKDVLGL